MIDNIQRESLWYTAFTGNGNPLLNAIDIDSRLLNIHDYSGYHVVHWLSRYGKIELIGKLLDRGCDVNVLHPKGLNALMFAAQSNKIDTAIYLISRGGDLDVKNEYGKTALCLYGCHSDEYMTISEKNNCRNILKNAFENGPLVFQRKKDANWNRRKYFMATLAGCKFRPLSYRKEIFTNFSLHIDSIVIDTPEKRRQYLLMQVFSNEGLVRCISNYL
jgi:hypothetical protein